MRFLQRTLLVRPLNVIDEQQLNNKSKLKFEIEFDLIFFFFFFFCKRTCYAKRRFTNIRFNNRASNNIGTNIGIIILDNIHTTVIRIVFRSCTSRNVTAPNIFLACVFRRRRHVISGLSFFFNGGLDRVHDDEERGGQSFPLKEKDKRNDEFRM
jgi:hypothetical protein